MTSAPTYSLERQTAGVKALADAMRPAIGEDDDALADLIEGETDALEAASRLLRWMGERQAYSAALKAYEADLSGRRKRLDDGVATARAALSRFMETVGLTKMERPEATLSIREAGPSVVYGIDFNPEALPEELRRWKCEADRPAVKAALEAGEEVPGATLNNGGTVLTVRVR
jgi:hypothetical protein